MNEMCIICGEEAKYECEHHKSLKIRYYCENHKPDLDEVCKEYEKNKS